MGNLKPLGTALLAGLFLATLADVSWSTEQAQQRQAGRDIKQTTRQSARDTKQDCRAANQQSNAACRQDKRQTKQSGRQTARDLKY
ncbi:MULTISPECIES: hypothetical protein [unclassified Rhizobium]|uniref:hypothetical protein n=1 Tax=unclassified Rhizobium TaxID=2613769 RepID=UPI001ADC4B89|nr:MULTISPECIES: hypothetical protein [unclassified Rhizobium]MBO9125211.1 hypothetical protein [Rhizobium sp. 16-488-2b]MBO9175796.1 hypothetical protein [Rhizobium sp. 16-488-2a]